MSHTRLFLFVVGAVSVLNGLFIFFFPNMFYNMIPGLDLMGPFSIHFIRDVGLAYVASGGAMLWGAKTLSRPVAISGAAWPFLHSLFHIQIWVHRGLPLDHIFFVNLFGVILVGILALLVAIRLSSKA